MLDMTWHRAQARKISAEVQKISRASITLSMFWWEVGNSLDQEYGHREPGRGRSQADMPVSDAVKLAKVYRVSTGSLTMARRFSNKARTREEAEAIATERGTWTSVLYWVQGKTSEEAEAHRQKGNRYQSEKGKADREAADKLAKHAHAMIPDAIRDGLDAELEGTDYDAKTSVEEVITRLGVSGLIEVMEQLKLIKKRRRVRVA